MILDTSALAAIALREPGHEALIDRIVEADQPPALNFGDCLSYAVAATAREELLYMGDNFALTDLGAS